MKKQFKLGSAVAGFLGLVLFGVSSPDGIASARGRTAGVGSHGDVDAALTWPAPTPDGDAKALSGDVLANLGLKPSGAYPAASASMSCADGMVEVEGDYCPYVEQKCVRWLDPESKQRCADFELRQLPPVRRRPPSHKHFCIDRFEYPNALGQKPAVRKDWYEAKANLRGRGSASAATASGPSPARGRSGSRTRTGSPASRGVQHRQAATSTSTRRRWPTTRAGTPRSPASISAELRRL